MQIGRHCLHFQHAHQHESKSQTQRTHILLYCSCVHSLTAIYTPGAVGSVETKLTKSHYHYSLVWGPISLFGVYVLHWNLHFSLFFWPHILDFLGHVSWFLFKNAHRKSYRCTSRVYHKRENGLLYIQEGISSAWLMPMVFQTYPNDLHYENQLLHTTRIQATFT